VGLERALRLPTGGGYFELQGGAVAGLGAFVRGEAGYRVHRNVGLFGFAEAGSQGAMAGAGVRVEW
jgi:hypothetical protein